MYVKINNGEVEAYPYTKNDLRINNPNTSFPVEMNDDFLANYGIYPVVVEAPPENDSPILGARTKDTPELIDGVWTLQWETFEKTAEVIERELEMETNSNRHIRNCLLLESDWTQVPDSALSSETQAAWRTYRTALRNLPDHENWPRLTGDDWPTKP